jgi:hypothetical protein
MSVENCIGVRVLILPTFFVLVRRESPETIWSAIEGNRASDKLVVFWILLYPLVLFWILDKEDISALFDKEHKLYQKGVIFELQSSQNLQVLV